MKVTIVKMLWRQKATCPKLIKLKYHGPFQSHHILQKELTSELSFIVDDPNNIMI